MVMFFDDCYMPYL
jgi:hypothetical protein